MNQLKKITFLLFDGNQTTNFLHKKGMKRFMMELSDNIHIQCSRCNHKFIIDKDFYEPNISYYDHGTNGMGEEVEYSIEDDIRCEICNNNISFKISGSEYPIGVFNSSDHSISGATFVSNPTFEMIYFPENDCQDEYKNLNDFLCKNQIDTLYHFTRVENLANIINYGLVPRNIIESNNIDSHFNDEWRYDNCTDANCLSIEFPNYKMFYSLRMSEPNTKWVVIKFKIQILFDFKCAYCWTNAGDSSMYTKSLQSRMGVAAFIDLYNNHPRYPKREDTKINNWYPTNPQAEILVFGTIPIKYVDCIYFQDYETLSAFKDIVPDNITTKVHSRAFSYRSDWKFW